MFIKLKTQREVFRSFDLVLNNYPQGTAYSISISPDDKYFAVGAGEPGGIHIYEFRGKAEIGTFQKAIKEKTINVQNALENYQFLNVHKSKDSPSLI